MRSLTLKNSFQFSIAVSLLVHMAVLALLFSISPRVAGRSPKAYVIDLVEEKPPPPPPVERSLPLLEEVPPSLEKSLPSPEEKAVPESMLGQDEVTEISPKAAEEAGENLLPSGEAEEKGKGEEPVTPEGFARGEELKKLFDPEVIQEFARKETPEEEGGGITFSMEEGKLLTYNMFLKSKVESKWKAPSEFYEKELTGVTEIYFVINKDGRLDRVELMESSGHKSLDEAAMKAIKDAAPFLPLPRTLKKNTLSAYYYFFYLSSGVMIFYY